MCNELKENLEIEVSLGELSHKYLKIKINQ